MTQPGATTSSQNTSRPMSFSDRESGNVAAGVGRAAHRRMLLLVGAATAAALMLTVRSQIYDTNFYLLWEAVAILEGDHPYRDFFDWGAPLAAYLSAAMQLVVGYRLIGEFLMGWLFITAGVVIAFHLGLRLSQSVGATLVMFLLALPIVAYAPTYHYSKLFFFPATIWLAWRYMDRPTPWRGAVCGFTAGAAFLFRHDYGVYIGFASVVAFVLARFAAPESRRPASLLKDAAAYAAGVAILVLPWAVVVQLSEGLIEYVQARTMLYERPTTTFVYPTLLMWNPVSVLTSWIRAPLSPEAAQNAALWLRQIGLLVPLFLLAAAGFQWRRSRRDGVAVPLDAWRMMLAGAFLAVVAAALFREPPYVVVSAPVTAALSATFLRRRSGLAHTTAVVVLILTCGAALIWTKDSPLFRPADLPRGLSRAYDQLMASPPIPAESTGAPSLRLQYLRDCSVRGDRLFVTGSTPYHIGYYARRGPAGGHLYWRLRWRRGDAHEQQSLELLQRQSVPFAISTNDKVLDDLRFYPRIREYMAQHYRALDGGWLLVDTRRQPTGTFEPLGYPCFR